jgi:hypothetical protein
VPTYGVVFATATFTVLAVNSADGPVSVFIGQSGAMDGYTLNSAPGVVTCNDDVALRGVRCHWPSPVVGDQITVELRLDNFGLDHAGDVIIVSAGASVGGVDLGTASATVTITQTTITVTPAVTVSPTQTPQNSSVAVTATFSVAQFSGDPIRVTLIVNGSSPTDGVSLLSASPNLTNCRNSGHLLHAVFCDWDVSAPGERATITGRYGDFSLDPVGSVVTVNAGAFPPFLEGWNAAVTITITGPPESLPPAATEAQPAFTG